MGDDDGEHGRRSVRQHLDPVAPSSLLVDLLQSTDAPGELAYDGGREEEEEVVEEGVWDDGA